MKNILFVFLLFASSLNATTITIAVAANVSYAIEGLKTAFSSMHPNIQVRVILGSSGKLTAQIKNGAPYGLFMSANMDYPKALYKDKLATTKPIIYAQGALALLSVLERNFSKGLELLQSKNIGRIAIANTKTAPYGKATKEALQNAGVYTKIEEKFVYGESISQTLSYTMTACDVGIVAKSLLYSPRMVRFKEDKNWISLDTKLYTPIKQGIVLLKVAQNEQAYKDFYDFILSEEAKSIFKKYGYITQ
jgi:molybdate transport system substrate-binding protein